MDLGSIRINEQILNNSKQMKCREIQEMMMMMMMVVVVVVIGKAIVGNQVGN